MASYKNLELRDGILKDAIILMNQNPDLKYEEAYEMAKKNLIGDEELLKLNIKKLDLEFEDKLISNQSMEKQTLKEGLSDDIYSPIRNLIDTSKYNNNQLKQYLIGYNMGIDITTFANPNFEPRQIKFLCTMMVAGKDVDQFLNDYDFDPNEVFSDVALGKSKQYIKKNTNN